MEYYPFNLSILFISIWMLNFEIHCLQMSMQCYSGLSMFEISQVYVGNFFFLLLLIWIHAFQHVLEMVIYRYIYTCLLCNGWVYVACNDVNSQARTYTYQDDFHPNIGSSIWIVQVTLLVANGYQPLYVIVTILVIVKHVPKNVLHRTALMWITYTKLFHTNFEIK